MDDLCKKLRQASLLYLPLFFMFNPSMAEAEDFFKQQTVPYGFENFT